MIQDSTIRAINVDASDAAAIRMLVLDGAITGDVTVVATGHDLWFKVADDNGLDLSDDINVLSNRAQQQFNCPTNVISGTLNLSGLTGMLQPNLTGSVNNYAPTDIATALSVYLLSDGAYDITGIVCATALEATPVGRLLILHNGSAHTLTLKHDSGSSAANNRFQCPGAGDYSLTTGSTALLFWSDGSGTNGWRVK